MDSLSNENRSRVRENTPTLSLLYTLNILCIKTKCYLYWYNPWRFSVKWFVPLLFAPTLTPLTINMTIHYETLIIKYYCYYRKLFP